LHGLAYGFFFVGGQIYTDRVASKDIRASAQSLMLLATLGVGKLISSLIAGPIKDHFTTSVDGQLVTDWTYVFMVPALVTLAGAAALILLFGPKSKEQLTAAGSVSPGGAIVPPSLSAVNEVGSR
jgi:MFS family permease